MTVNVNTTTLRCDCACTMLVVDKYHEREAIFYNFSMQDSKYSNINGKVLLAVVSKNFAKVPKTIPKHSISIVFIIFLVMGISFSILLILFKNLFIMHL